MPSYRVFLLEEPEGHEGSYEEWDLPFERLVFDQRLDYRPEGAAEVGRYKVRRIRDDAEGIVYEVAPDPGCLRGGDPKRVRP